MKQDEKLYRKSCEKAQESLDELEKEVASQGMIITSFYESGKKENCISLQALRMRKTAPKRAGSKAMDALCHIADVHKLIITISLGTREPPRSGLAANWKRTTSCKRLLKFYRRFGFQGNTARSLYHLRGTMHRNPQTEQP